jgi:hypothetical protein
MRKRAASAVALAAVLVLGVGSAALATHTVEIEEHVVPFTVGDVTGAVTITDEDVLPHETITETTTTTVTVTEPPPTTTEPPPTTTEPPPPSGVCLVSNRDTWALTGSDCSFGTQINFTNEQFVCTQPLASYGQLPLKLVWNFTGNPDFGDQGHLSFRAGCRGDGNDDTIDVIVASNANGVTVGAAGGAGKFQTAGPTDIQITGNFDCGPLGSSAAHQDTWQFHPDWPVARLDIVNGTSGDWSAGTATCIGAGGAIFFSNRYDVDVYGGQYVTCNHGYFGNSTSSNQVVGVGFRTGRVDGSDPRCQGYNASDPCLGQATFQNVTCERWIDGAWVSRPPG